MRRLLICSSILGFALALAACGSDSTTAAGGTTSGATGAGGGSTAGSGGSGSGTTGSTSGTGGSAPAVPAYKSYVILGDSISDHGGVGPFFYDILATNDD